MRHWMLEGIGDIQGGIYENNGKSLWITREHDPSGAKIGCQWSMAHPQILEIWQGFRSGNSKPNVSWRIVGHFYDRGHQKQVHFKQIRWNRVCERFWSNEERRPDMLHRVPAQSDKVTGTNLWTKFVDNLITTLYQDRPKIHALNW